MRFLDGWGNDEWAEDDDERPSPPPPQSTVPKPRASLKAEHTAHCQEFQRLIRKRTAGKNFLKFAGTFWGVEASRLMTNNCFIPPSLLRA